MSEKVLVYDTTLRDGMQGEGMSLSAGEKVRVAHALDSLGVHLIEAGFPASNPKEEELFELLARERFVNAEVAAFGMTRRRDVSAADDPALQAAGRLLRPGLHIGRQDLVAPPREGHEGGPRGEPADDRRVGGVPRGRGEARGLRRGALLRRLARRPRVRAALPPRRRRGRRRERDALRHERLLAARRGGAGHRRGGRGARRGAGGHPHPRRRRLRRGQLARGRRGTARAWCRAP